MGIQNTFILIGVLAMVTLVMPALLMLYGKRARAKTAVKYREFASRQQTQRCLTGVLDFIRVILFDFLYWVVFVQLEGADSRYALLNECQRLLLLQGGAFGSK